MTNVRHDWYQTESQVTIEILVRNQKSEDVKVVFDRRKLIVELTLPSGDFKLDVQLAHEVVVEKCSYRVLSTKIEVKLGKTEAIRWSSLEAKETSVPEPKMVSADEEAKKAPKYPTSSSKKLDWDKLEKQIEKEEAEEKPIGEAAVNDLFKKIYQDGSDEVRKAMNKSFQESGGTVLSTNWGDVAANKVDVKPPDGTEFKKYD